MASPTPAELHAFLHDEALLPPGAQVLRRALAWICAHPVPLAQFNVARPQAAAPGLMEAITLAHAGRPSRVSLLQPDPELHLALRAHGYTPGPPLQFLWRDLPLDLPGPDPGLVQAQSAPQAQRWAEAFLHNQGRHLPPCPSSAWQQLAGSSHRLLWVERQGEILATAALGVDPGRSWGLLWGACTQPQVRGQGLYRALLAARVALARALGLRGLLALASPQGAGASLRRLGFQGLGQALVAWERDPDHS